MRTKRTVGILASEVGTDGQRDQHRPRRRVRLLLTAGALTGSVLLTACQPAPPPVQHAAPATVPVKVTPQTVRAMATVATVTPAVPAATVATVTPAVPAATVAAVPAAPQPPAVVVTAPAAAPVTTAPAVTVPNAPKAPTTQAPAPVVTAAKAPTTAVAAVTAPPETAPVVTAAKPPPPPAAASVVATTTAPSQPAQPAPIRRSKGATIATNPVWNPAYVGQCTWGAQERWNQATGSFMVVEGDAWAWADSAAAHGWTVTSTPSTRAMVIFPRGVAGAYTTTGHVAWVTSVSRHADGVYIDVSEMDWTFGRYNWDTRTLKNEPGMSYILAP